MDSDQDQDVIDQLISNGSDVSKIHHIEFIIYGENKSLSAIESEAMKAGFAKDTEQSENDSSFVLTKEMIPNIDNIAAASNFLTNTCYTHGGDYDGLSTSIIK